MESVPNSVFISREPVLSLLQKPELRNVKMERNDRHETTVLTAQSDDQFIKLETALIETVGKEHIHFHDSYNRTLELYLEAEKEAPTPTSPIQERKTTTAKNSKLWGMFTRDLQDALPETPPAEKPKAPQAKKEESSDKSSPFYGMFNRKSKPQQTDSLPKKEEPTEPFPFSKRKKDTKSFHRFNEPKSFTPEEIKAQENFKQAIERKFPNNAIEVRDNTLWILKIDQEVSDEDIFKCLPANMPWSLELQLNKMFIGMKQILLCWVNDAVRESISGINTQATRERIFAEFNRAPQFAHYLNTILSQYSGKDIEEKIEKIIKEIQFYATLLQKLQDHPTDQFLQSLIQDIEALKVDHSKVAHFITYVASLAIRYCNQNTELVQSKKQASFQAAWDRELQTILNKIQRKYPLCKPAALQPNTFYVELTDSENIPYKFIQTLKQETSLLSFDIIPRSNNRWIISIPELVPIRISPLISQQNIVVLFLIQDLLVEFGKRKTFTSEAWEEAFSQLKKNSELYTRMHNNLPGFREEVASLAKKHPNDLQYIAYQLFKFCALSVFSQDPKTLENYTHSIKEEGREGLIIYNLPENTLEWAKDFLVEKIGKPILDISRLFNNRIKIIFENKKDTDAREHFHLASSEQQKAFLDTIGKVPFSEPEQAFIQSFLKQFRELFPNTSINEKNPRLFIIENGKDGIHEAVEQLVNSDQKPSTLTSNIVATDNYQYIGIQWVSESNEYDQVRIKSIDTLLHEVDNSLQPGNLTSTFFEKLPKQNQLNDLNVFIGYIDDLISLTQQIQATQLGTPLLGIIHFAVMNHFKRPDISAFGTAIKDAIQKGDKNIFTIFECAKEALELAKKTADQVN